MKLPAYHGMLIPCLALIFTLHSMDHDPSEQFLRQTALIHQALIEAVKKGDINAVMSTIRKDPATITCHDNHSNALVVIAALHKHEKLVKRLVQEGARIDIFEYFQIWGKLAQLPQAKQDARILSFLQFTLSKEFLSYHTPSDKTLSYLVSCLPSFIRTFFAYLRTIIIDTTTNSALKLLQVAAFDNNHLSARRILQEVASSPIKPLELTYAASIATREFNNHFLALYILFAHSSPLIANEIFFNRITDAPMYN